MYQISLFASFFLLASVYGDHGSGHSDVFRKQDGKNYDFGYKIHDPWGSHFQKESGDPWAKHGSYGLKLADGRERVVKYVADKGGFRAKIYTNEPGTGSVDAANAIYNGNDPHGYSLTHVPSGNKGGHGDYNGYGSQGGLGVDGGIEKFDGHSAEGKYQGHQNNYNNHKNHNNNNQNIPNVDGIGHEVSNMFNGHEGEVYDGYLGD